jgi:hypothetical protein
MLEPLQVFAGVPAGCRIILVPTDKCEPLLHAGEFAVVDTTRREPRDGALVAIRQSIGDVIWRLKDLGHDHGLKNHDGSPTLERCFYLSPPVPNARSAAEAFALLRAAGRPRLSDGPVGDAYVRDRIVGEVIGVYRSDDEAALTSSACDRE